MKPLRLFLSGSLFGVCVTVGAFYLRGPVSQRLLPKRADSHASTKITVALRAVETSLGAAAAPVAIIEYSDFQCPYCASFWTKTLPKIKAQYIDSGQLRFIHRDLPLPFHPQAMLAAEAATCAGDQGLFWEFSSVMFSRASCLECQGAMELSKAIPLKRQEFEECVASARHHADIEQDAASAKLLNFRGTPSFVVGRTTPAGVEGVSFSGALPYEEFSTRIEEFLDKPAQ